MMIAGPNGAGKTTIASALTSQQKDIYEEFINADQIAQGLSPLHPESVSIEAGILMIERFHVCVREGKSFVFETTGAGLSYATHLKNAQKNGYELNLMFVWISSPDQAVKRVAQRVKQGGHHIPEDIIRRRYYRGLKNLVSLYLPIVDTALIIDNSSAVSSVKKVIAKKGIGTPLKIDDMENWEKIMRLANGKDE